MTIKFTDKVPTCDECGKEKGISEVPFAVTQEQKKTIDNIIEDINYENVKQKYQEIEINKDAHTILNKLIEEELINGLSNEKNIEKRIISFLKKFKNLLEIEEISPNKKYVKIGACTGQQNKIVLELGRALGFKREDMLHPKYSKHANFEYPNFVMMDSFDNNGIIHKFYYNKAIIDYILSFNNPTSNIDDIIYETKKLEK